MNLVIAFFRLIRSLNLLFIVLTQYLFQYFIVVPIFRKHGLSSPMNEWEFALLSLSSVLIAAAGYIINDYFDLNIDKINKPQKLVVEKHIKRRWAIIWHWMLSFLGVVIGFFLSWQLHAWWLGFANLGCVAALWFYSTIFKKRLLSGNIIISLLTAWVVMVVGFIAHYNVMSAPDLYVGIDRSKILRFTFLYAGFAFIISLIREVVKDIEDMDGDAKYGCNTMPIIWGVRVSKVFAATWMVVLIGALLIVTAYVLQLGWWIPAVYCLILIVVPLLQLLRKLKVAVTTKQFHYISGLIKVVMFTGILSMIFFRMY